MTPERFKLIFTEFGEADAERVQAFIDMAGPHLSEERWGDLYEQGLANYVAHTMATANVRAAQAGTVLGASSMSSFQTSKKVGDVAVTISDVMIQHQAKNPLLTTTYGIEFARLRRLVGMGVMAV